MKETVLTDDLTRCGLRRIHVVGMKRVEREKWIDLAPVEARETLQVLEWEEAGVAWHLVVMWKAREAVRLPDGGCGVMWWCGGPEKWSVREAALAAAGVFRMVFGWEPESVGLRKAPEGKVEVEGLRLESWSWAPAGFVVVR
jgi:hypothetical protein